MEQRRFIFLIIIFIGFMAFNHAVHAQSRLDSIIELGDDLLSLNDYKGAENKYEQALKIRENYLPAMKSKINVLLLRDRYNKAQKMAEEAIEKHGSDPSFHLYIGKALIAKERYEEALVHLNSASGLVDDEDKEMLNKIYVNKGAVFQKQNDFNNALENYSKALEINKTNPNVFVYRGNLYYKKENYDKALSDFQKVLDLDPNNHVAQYNIGMCFFKQGEKLNACDAFHKACELGNKNACKMVISKCLRSNEVE